MCGRTACALDKDTICRRCALRVGTTKKVISPKWSSSPNDPPYHPSYNQAPGGFSPVLMLENEDQGKSKETIIRPMLWGLVPSFAKGTEMKGYATSNARIESLLQKPLYSQSMRRGWRCIVPVEGFYEWKTVGGQKQPYFIYMDDPSKMLMMAGLYSYNQTKQIFSYSVITTNAKGLMTKVHHRMPVVLSTDEEVYLWLDTETESMDKAYNLLVKVANNLDKAPLCMHKVTPRMNSTRYNEPDCTLPIEDSECPKSTTKEGSSKLLTTFLKRPKQSDDGLEPLCKKKGDHKEDRLKTSNIKKEEESIVTTVKKEEQ